MTTLKPVRRATTSNGVSAVTGVAWKRRLRTRLQPQIFPSSMKRQRSTTSGRHVLPSTPDFQVGDIHLEVKGLFDVQARHKMLLVKQQHPDLDIRFVFSNANAPIYKGSPTSYAQWCDKHGFYGRTAGYQTNGYAPLNKKEKPMLNDAARASAPKFWKPCRRVT